MRKNKGFTLIELMIVIAIIAIIAAIAIPNLLQSRIRANESNAVSQIRNYANAQSIFEARQCGLLPGNRGRSYAANAQGYCADYPLLYSGTTVVAGGGSAGGTYASGAQLRLIGIAHAEAAYNSPIAVGSGSATTGVAFNGYFFTEPADVIKDNAFYNFSYAQIAAPEDSSRTGGRIFYFDDNGTPYSKLLAADVKVADSIKEDTPYTSDAGWSY